LDLSLLTINTVIGFLLVLFRIGGMMVSAPLFNMRSIPPQAKVGMAVAIAFLLFPLHASKLVVPTDLIQFALLAIQETILGLLIGFTANLVFMAVQMAGDFISTQMGLSIASVLDPITGSHAPVMGQFFFYLSAMLFLSLNIHHGLIIGVDRSFDWVPLGHFIGEGKLTGAVVAERFIKLTGDILLMALMVGGPVIGVLLATEIALSFVAKVMPQMNVFMVAMPLKVALGLMLILTSLPYLSTLLGDRYAYLMQVLLGLYKT
jgi:flagellar biosynthetic protein FliR